jgi:hypothetical protein
MFAEAMAARAKLATEGRFLFMIGVQIRVGREETIQPLPSLLLAASRLFAAERRWRWRIRHDS